MHHFAYKGGELHCEDVALSAIAREVGTPVYVYSAATLRRHYRVLSEAFSGMDCLIAFSVKANSNLAVLSLLRGLGAGADVVSAGELRRALAAGIPADRIVFSGVAKGVAEIDAALAAGIHQFNVESLPELIRLSERAVKAGVEAPVAFRVNPHVSAGGHANISTGKASDKFGIAWHEAEDFYDQALALPGIDVCGVDVHIGSQIADLAPMREAFGKVIDLVHRLRARGCPISRVDLGGGLAIPYAAGDHPASPADYATMIAEMTAGLDVQVILEPGRMIAGNAGILLTAIEYTKSRDDRLFAICDAGMNDLMRPALYGAHHEILTVRERAATEPLHEQDLVGPICESTDRFATARRLPSLAEGDLLALMSAGAYGAVMSNQYNTRPLCAEVLVDEARYEIVRRRPTFEDMTANEQIPDWLT